jgi:hypothetical protein
MTPRTVADDRPVEEPAGRGRTMPAMVPEPPGEVPPPAPPGAPDAHRQVRYNYLVGRLRSRQITMEEATELFALMQALLRASEAARRVTGAALPRPGPIVVGPMGETPRVPAAPSASDDMFLVGLLAMGAGAGLLAAMARRLSEGPPPQETSGSNSGGRRTG